MRDRELDAGVGRVDAIAAGLHGLGVGIGTAGLR